MKKIKKKELNLHFVPGRGTAAGGAIPIEALQASEKARKKTPKQKAQQAKDPYQEDRVSPLEPSYADLSR